jgi:hypothetical protein
VRDAHDGSSDEKEGATTETIHRPDTGDDSDKLCDVDDTTHEELHVILESHCFEQSRRVIDESIDADELLELANVFDGR